MVGRGAGQNYSFELVPEEEPDGGLAVYVGSDAGLDGDLELGLDRDSDGGPPSAFVLFIRRVVSVVRATSRRRALIAGAAVMTLVAVGYAGGGVAKVVREHQRVERLLAAPGGVRSLGDELTERWQVDTDSGPLAVMTGGVVVARSGSEIVGIEPETGVERWRTEMGGQAECGPNPQSPAEWARSVERLVCLSGPDEAPFVAVVDAAGNVLSRRSLDPITFRTVASLPDGGAMLEPSKYVLPAGDGGLVVVERTGERSPHPMFENEEEAIAALERGLERGQGAVVRMEDAATGAVRWEREVPFEPVEALNATGCGTFTYLGSTIVLDATQTLVTSRPDLVMVSSCGVDAAFTAGGESLGAAPDYYWATQRTTYVDGGYVVPRTETSDALLDDAGRQIIALQGRLQSPMATDGSGAETLLVLVGSQELVAVDRSGQEQWSRRFSGSQTGLALVRADGAFVVVDGEGGVHAIELETGKDRWTIEPGKLIDINTDAWTTVGFAATDGRSAFLAIGAPGDAETRLVTLDLRTGSVGWDVQRAGGFVQIAAAGGTLVERVGTGMTTGENLADGTFVERDPGTLTGLGGG